jgi:hypothetical protein
MMSLDAVVTAGLPIAVSYRELNPCDAGKSRSTGLRGDLPLAHNRFAAGLGEASLRLGGKSTRCCL